MSDVRAICKLSDDDFEARRRVLREGLLRRVRAREELRDGVALHFDATQDTLLELADFLAFERECCPGLGIALSEEATGLRLEIRGIDQAASVLTLPPAGSDREAMSRGTTPPFLRRLFRAGGIGVLGSLVVCCVAPVGLAALLGAVPLTTLDDPWLMGAGALALGGLYWRFERRREAARTERASDGGCGC